MNSYYGPVTNNFPGVSATGIIHSQLNTNNLGTSIIALWESDPECGRSPFFAVDQLHNTYREELAF